MKQSLNAFLNQLAPDRGRTPEVVIIINSTGERSPGQEFLPPPQEKNVSASNPSPRMLSEKEEAEPPGPENKVPCREEKPNQKAGEKPLPVLPIGVAHLCFLHDNTRLVIDKNTPCEDKLIQLSYKSVHL